MKVEIWSDVACPFCYIGKRRFEEALEQFPHKDQLQVEWRSFQLNPDLKDGVYKNLEEYLSKTKGWPVEQVRQIQERVTSMAADAGLHFNMENTVLANTYRAHCLIQMAKAAGKGDEMEEILFRAYFIDGKNVSEKATLTELGVEAGLDRAAVSEMLEKYTYASQVQLDVMEAKALGVNGVPFFVMNRRYAVSGAQESEAFLQILEKSFAEWQQQPTTLEVNEGETCTTDGNCG
ncbi:Predicted dithiol-disulfide isomerase, DsbA family [Filimonas lacunae]|uniref:Predicted dithiol-disulfide isomerase, DsbA family n=1 Tax=Filimonas lacunae TaxID=477680 RepID=A0A173MQ34_9BACT|nr:DsbA family oxidoreductase [Filimonas lacunae]BAV09773.1 2-hydroxychromene-2-carboxylate isomerase [Filimonas lacunae]SIS78781.1 Predicted dithiol-disulfide isomerase, DsbA family [Filimonas lacunae]